MIEDITDHIILFDGVCNLCNSLVKFIIQRDKEGKMKFAPIQSQGGRELINAAGHSPESIKTIVYISEGKYYYKSTAILRILKDLGRGWNLLYAFIIIPRFLRDPVYDLVAATRYRIFGKKDSCMVPSEEIKGRFMQMSKEEFPADYADFRRKKKECHQITKM